ncbi:MAG: hypothetical protein QMB54_07845, partial [Neofamilia sp.]
TGGLDRDAAIESVWTEMKKDPSVWAIDPTWAVEDGEAGMMFFLKGDSFVKQHRSWSYGDYPLATSDYFN